MCCSSTTIKYNTNSLPLMELTVAEESTQVIVLTGRWKCTTLLEGYMYAFTRWERTNLSTHCIELQSTASIYRVYLWINLHTQFNCARKINPYCIRSPTSKPDAGSNKKLVLLFRSAIRPNDCSGSAAKWLSKSCSSNMACLLPMKASKRPQYRSTSSVSRSPTMIIPLRARVIATFKRRQSVRKPKAAMVLLRTVEMTTTSFSRPWNASTEEHSTMPAASGQEIISRSFRSWFSRLTWAEYGVMTPMSPGATPAATNRSTVCATIIASGIFWKDVECCELDSCPIACGRTATNANGTPIWGQGNPGGCTRSSGAGCEAKQPL